MLAAVLLAVTIGVAGPPGAVEYLPVRLAVAEGYFAAEGVAVTLRPFASEAAAAEALARGRVDLAATSVDAALRLGHVRGAPPRLLAGLTAAPPVALLVATAARAEIREPADLAGKAVGIPAPGTPEAEALGWLLARAGLDASRIEMRSFGDRGLAAALAAGVVAAGMLGEPWASRLVEDGAAVAVVDFRRRAEIARWLGGEPVHAGVFVRAGAAPAPTALAAVRRALARALGRMRDAPPEALATALGSAAAGPAEQWGARLAGARDIYLADGRVAGPALEAAVDLARRRAALPYVLDLPRRIELLLVDER